MKSVLLGALLGACTFVFSLFFTAPGWSAGLHPRCNIDFPCQVFGSKEITIRANKIRHKSSFLASEEIAPHATKRQAREARRIARGQRLEQAMPFGAPIYRPETQRSFLSGGATILPHPAGCPRRAFCGCGAAVEVFGRPIRSLWLARNWLAFPRAAPAPGMVAARRGHVFVIRQVLGGGKVLAYDANSGRRQTRLHVRSLAGFVVVNPHGAS